MQTAVSIKTDSIVTDGELQAIMEIMQPVVPPVGSTVDLGGIRYKVRQITDTDLILTAIGLTA